MLTDIEKLLQSAMDGDKIALEKIIISIKDKIYNLSLRMLWNPSDAEDVTQEILIKVITNLSKFRGESKFSTWVYSIAANHLISINKRGLEHQKLSFEIFEKGMEEGLDLNEATEISGVDRNILAQELKVSCTHAMLLCLDRESRVIYILSSFFKVNSNEGAYIIGITPENYRKRLSRIREKMRNFMENNCGLVNENRSCKCNRRIEIAVKNRRINPERLIFVNQLLAEKDFIEDCSEEMEQFDKVSAVFMSNPYYLTPEKIIEDIKNLVNTGNYKILEA